MRAPGARRCSRIAARSASAMSWRSERTWGFATIQPSEVMRGSRSFDRVDEYTGERSGVRVNVRAARENGPEGQRDARGSSCAVALEQLVEAVAEDAREVGRP